MPAAQPSPAERFAALSQMPDFSVIANFLTDYGTTVLTNGASDVLSSWCVSALPATGGTMDDDAFRACTVSAGRMEVAFIVIVDSEDEYGLIGCVFVRRTHFLAAAGMSVTALRDQFELLDFDPDVKYRAARLMGEGDAMRIYVNLLDPASVKQLETTPWRESAKVLVDHLRTGALMPKWSQAHSDDLANYLMG